MRAFAAIPILMTLVITGGPGEIGAANLEGELSRLDPWIGTWNFDGQWSNGSTLWAQAEYNVLLNGAFLDGRVFVRDNGGELYQRYRTVFAWNDIQGAVATHTFSKDGSYTLDSMTVDGAAATTEWSAGTTTISERMEIEDADTMRWQVWATKENSERELVMDGRWRRSSTASIELGASPASTDLARFSSLLGGWEASATSADGTPLWARTEYRSGLAGRFINASTWSVDDQGNGHQRYETIFTSGSDTAGGEALNFNQKGAVMTATWRPTADAGIEIRGESESGDGLVQQLLFDSATTISWQVSKRHAPDSDWTQLIDASWRRQGPAAGHLRENIDPDRFVAAGTDLRSFAKERIIDAPVDQVFASWTTSEGWGKLWGAPAASRFDLAIGGPYEWKFNGWLGSNGCQVLSYIPNRMVSFSWNAPPTQAHTRLFRTWVVVETEALDQGRTRVRLTHLGFGNGSEWDETFNYFENAWERVLGLMESALGGDSQ